MAIAPLSNASLSTLSSLDSSVMHNHKPIAGILKLFILLVFC